MLITREQAIQNARDVEILREAAVELVKIIDKHGIKDNFVDVTDKLEEAGVDLSFLLEDESDDSVQAIIDQIDRAFRDI